MIFVLKRTLVAEGGVGNHARTPPTLYRLTVAACSALAPQPLAPTTEASDRVPPRQTHMQWNRVISLSSSTRLAVSKSTKKRLRHLCCPGVTMTPAVLAQHFPNTTQALALPICDTSNERPLVT